MKKRLLRQPRYFFAFFGNRSLWALQGAKNYNTFLVCLASLIQVSPEPPKLWRVLQGRTSLNLRERFLWEPGRFGGRKQPGPPLQEASFGFYLDHGLREVRSAASTKASGLVDVAGAHREQHAGCSEAHGLFCRALLVCVGMRRLGVPQLLYKNYHKALALRSMREALLKKEKKRTTIESAPSSNRRRAGVDLRGVLVSATDNF